MVKKLVYLEILSTLSSLKWHIDKSNQLSNIINFTLHTFLNKYSALDLRFQKQIIKIYSIS